MLIREAEAKPSIIITAMTVSSPIFFLLKGNSLTLEYKKVKVVFWGKPRRENPTKIYPIVKLTEKVNK